jgi:hypothetical protein
VNLGCLGGIRESVGGRQGSGGGGMKRCGGEKGSGREGEDET